MFTMLKLTRSDTKKTVLIAPDTIKRLEPHAGYEEPGCTVFAPEAGGQFKVEESAAIIAGGIGHAIQWNESRVVQSQLEAAHHMEQKVAHGVLLAQPRIDLNGN